jgi:hypothetical protein
MVADLRRTIPKGDCVVMMASLYHFMPDHAALVRRCLDAASRRLVLTEPVENVTASSNAVIQRVSAWASDPGDGTSQQRMTKQDLEHLLQDVPGGRVVHRAREWVLVWDKVSIGMGHYFRRRHEHIVFASKGRRKLNRKDFPDVWRF